MVYFVIAGGVLLVLLMMMGIYFYYKNKYDFLYIKLKEADNNLDIILQKKVEVLLKMLPELEQANISNIPNIVKFKTKKLSHQKLYQELILLGDEIIKIIEEHEEIFTTPKMQELINIFEDNENDLRATLKYYNDSVTDITFYSHHFPSNLVKALAHLEDVENYKIQKREKFAILQNN